MGVNLTMGAKAKEAQLPEVEQAQIEDLEQAAEVDELAALMVWATKQAKHPNMVRLAELKKKFTTLANDAPEDQEEVVFEGIKTRYKFGAPSTERTVTEDGKKLFANKIGEEAFLEVINVPLGAIDKYIPKVEQDDYIEKSNGSRTGKIEAKVVKK